MADLISKNQPNLSEADSNNTEDQEEKESQNFVTSHLCLRPTHTSQSLDKEEVLRRIRHRKRMNKVRNAVHGFFGCPAVPAKSDKAVSVRQMKWVDDAFAAP